MQRSIRYTLSAGVGLAALVLTTAVTDGSHTLVAMVPSISGTTVAFVLDNIATVRATYRDGGSRVVGIAGGGIGAGGLTGLFNRSIAAGTVGYGLFSFGTAPVTAELSGHIHARVWADR